MISIDFWLFYSKHTYDFPYDYVKKPEFYTPEC